MKDLGVITSADLKFREHINDVITSCKIKQGNILKNFSTRKREPMMIRQNIILRVTVWRHPPFTPKVSPLSPEIAADLRLQSRLGNA